MRATRRAPARPAAEAARGVGGRRFPANSAAGARPHKLSAAEVRGARAFAVALALALVMVVVAVLVLLVVRGQVGESDHENE